MTFSILIANYNNAKFISQTLQSIYNQTIKPTEIIIVDDGSTDDSIQIITEHQQEHPEIQLFQNNNNYGCGYTKRRCVEEASGEVCAFVDPDDTITSTAVEDMLQAHSSNPKASLIYSRLYFTDENLENPKERALTPKVPKEDAYFLNAEGEISHFVSFKRKFYQKTEGIDAYLQRAVDLDLYLKLYEVGEVTFLDKFHYYYRIHKGGISKTSNSDKANYWRWVVNINAARRRGINLEDDFTKKFVPMNRFNAVRKKYYSLKKFEPINTIWKRLKGNP